MGFRNAKPVIGTRIPAFAGFCAGTSVGQRQIVPADNPSSIKLVFPVQGRAEWLHQSGGAPEDGDWSSRNTYVRSLRPVVGGRLNDRGSCSADTDSPNTGKFSSTGAREIPEMFVQDFPVTWTCNDALRFDSGRLLTPLTRVARQEIHNLGSDETTSQIGPAWWIDGIETTLKCGWTHAKKDARDARDRFQLQCQMFSF